MSKIVYATYYDHVARAGYRPDVCTVHWNSCDVSVIFGGDEEECDAIRSYGMAHEIINIDRKVSVPTDIPKAFNKCINHIWDTYDADWIVWCHGDIHITKTGDKYIRKFIQAGIDGTGMMAGTVPIMHHMLYAQQYNHPYTIQIMSDGVGRITFDETQDGEVSNLWNPICADDNDMFLEFGYLGTPQYYAKVNNHQHIWGQDGHKALFLKHWDCGDKEKAVRLVYKALKNYRGGVGLIGLNMDVYGELIERLELMDDCKYCSKFLPEYA
jgi:hypothetical protein